jgi:DNA-binding PadR family transcriptional regulator
MTQPNIQSFLPLSEPTFLILLSLAPEAKPGYTVMKDIETLSEGRAAAGATAFQANLDRLQAQGWIEHADGQQLDEAGYPQQHYALSVLGRRILHAEVGRLRAMVRAARLSTPEVDDESAA